MLFYARQLLATALLFYYSNNGILFVSAFHGTNLVLSSQFAQENPLKMPSIKTLSYMRTKTQLKFSQLPPIDRGSDESSLLFWIAAFSSSHIGMSAIRQTLITTVFGKYIANDVLGIVGTKKLRLPEFWPGDSSGTNELFPDIETTGRQIYRIFYTIVSFLTLGMSFSIYLQIRGEEKIHRSISILDTIGGASIDSTEFLVLLSYAVATLSGAFSLASLVNASPLGLMPSFYKKKDDEELLVASSNGRKMVAASTSVGDTLLGITRDDNIKFDPKGLTRITRHPLILPVVPWGLATSVLVGGQRADAILFCGLSLYAIAGCYCQGLRVLREEGSVGTVFFDPTSNNDDDNKKIFKKKINQKLRSFYDETSFLPFQALFEGRQSWRSMIQELPVLAFLLAIPSAFEIEKVFLQFLGIEFNFF